MGPSEELLRLLVCPETHQPVRTALPDVLLRLNERIAAGEIRSLGGSTVEAPLESGLVREDGKLIYPVRDGIPVMLIDEAIPLGS